MCWKLAFAGDLLAAGGQRCGAVQGLLSGASTAVLCRLETARFAVCEKARVVGWSVGSVGGLVDMLVCR